MSMDELSDKELVAELRAAVGRARNAFLECRKRNLRPLVYFGGKYKEQSGSDERPGNIWDSNSGHEPDVEVDRITTTTETL